MQRHGWTLLFHEGLIEQLRRLQAAAERAEQSDPSRDEYRQGNTWGPAHRHWRRAKIGRRFRLFFRYDAKSRAIAFDWINDEQTLRSAGSKSDPYAVFEKMPRRGNPPDDRAALMAASKADWQPSAKR
jgi:toxin YhaV